jgi:predicted RND superfamily exporter protein
MRKELIAGLIHLTLRHRWIIWLVTIVLTVLMGWASNRIVLDVRWSTLLPNADPKVKEYKKIDRAFLQPGNMIVTVSGPDEVMLEQITDEVTRLLEEKLVAPPGAGIDEIKATERYARHVYGKVPEEWLVQNALWLANPKDAKRYRDLLRDPRLLSFLEHLNDDFEREYTDSENVRNKEREIVASLDAVHSLAEVISSAAEETVAPDRIDRTVRDLTLGRPYMFSLDNTMSLVLVASAVPSDDSQTVPLVDKKVEELLAPLQEKYPNYKIERTGLIPVFRDEMDSIGPQTQFITLLAFGLVFLLLVWNFRSIAIPVLAVIPIIVGIIWAMGMIGLVLGMMNIMTVMIMVVLLGLGIDFSIHLVCRFFEEMKKGKTPETALWLSVDGTGTGVITGAVTSAIAFLMLMTADTRGIYEFGFCAGAGVLVQLLAVFWLLPSMMMVYAERRLRKGKDIPEIREVAFLPKLTRIMIRRRVPVTVIIIVLVAAGVASGFGLEWEWNFLNLEPKGLRSVALQDEIIEKFKLSPTISMFTAPTVEESRKYREELKKKRPIGTVDDISLWVSRPDVDENRPYIAELRGHAGRTRAEIDYTDPAVRTRLLEEVDRLWANLVEIQALSITGGQDRVVEKTKQLVAVRENREAGLLRRLVKKYEDAASINWVLVARTDRSFTQQLENRVEKMLTRDDPVTLDMVPRKMYDRYVSDQEPGFLVQVYPKKSLYARAEMEVFQDTVSKVADHVTGTPQMLFKMNTEMIEEGRLAFILAAVVILVVLFIDFRTVWRGFVPIVPLITGIGLLLGLLWIFGQKLNYINVIGLPVIIGIGVDNGVHLLHRAIVEGRERLPEAVSSVGRAVIMSSLTTMIGFGSLMLYLMRGMASLGLVLFFGVGFCLLATFTILPAVICISSKWIYREYH